ncbi:MAG TPA: sigma-70 family RNA polymerase sigma factor [Pseudomonadales bacterium]|nr:sigma-70 family RNA polymerase sigma factor [Pseudomonadales bacterium]
MTDVPDAELLERFARNDSEAAFAALVERYVALVHSVARRHTANPQQAQDITQAVFIILARKAGGLSGKTVLPGWLYQTARLTAANFQRAEMSRIRREQEAFMQSTLEEPANDTLWLELSPQLDKAMACLGANERDALVLRYFQNKSMADVGRFLGLEENTAQKRVGRALEKLRKFFAKRGVASTTAIIAGVISANSVQAAPTGLAKTISVAAVAKGAAASASTLTLAKGALKIMAWTKMNTAVAVGVGILLMAGTATVTVKTMEHYSEYYRGKTLKQWLVNLDDQHPGTANDEAEAAVRHFGVKGLPTIISMLKMSDPMHHNAVLACQILGPEAKPAIPYLVNLLESGYSNGYVGVALDRIGPEAIPALMNLATNRIGQPRIGYVSIRPGVTERAVDIDDGARCEAASALGNLPMYLQTKVLLHYDVSQALITCLKDPSPYVRTLAARSLGENAMNEATVVPALIETLGDTDFQTRWSACLALGKFGPRAGTAVPALQAALHDRKAEVRATAAIALIEIEPDNTAQLDSLMPALIENINGIGGRDINFRSTTADALAAWGSRARPAVPALLDAIAKSSSYEQQFLVADLKKIDAEAAAKAGWE